MNSFEDLKVWQKSRDLCRQVFNLIQIGIFARDFALRDQINRSSGSVMDNIAEGFGRQSCNEFIQHLSIASGSLTEVKSQLFRALDRDYIPTQKFEQLAELIVEIGKMLTALTSYLNKSEIRGLTFKDRNSKPKNNN